MVSILTQPITASRLEECISSAKFWAENIGIYGATMRMIADNYSIATALLSAITSLAVWTTFVSKTDEWPFVLLVSLVALSSSAVAIIPKQKGYGKCAEDSSSLAQRYGHVMGDLLDAHAAIVSGDKNAQDLAKQAIKDFEEAKLIKDSLTPFPKKLQAQRNAQKQANVPITPTLHKSPVTPNP